VEYKTLEPNTNKTVSTILKEWTTLDFRNTPSTTNLEEQEIVEAPGNYGSASMPEQFKRPNPWRKMMMIYRVIQEKYVILWEMIVCVILSKKVHMSMGPILNGYRDMVKRRYGPSCEHEQQLRNK